STGAPVREVEPVALVRPDALHALAFSHCRAAPLGAARRAPAALRPAPPLLPPPGLTRRALPPADGPPQPRPPAPAPPLPEPRRAADRGRRARGPARPLGTAGLSAPAPAHGGRRGRDRRGAAGHGRPHLERQAEAPAAVGGVPRRPPDGRPPSRPGNCDHRRC